MKILLFVFGFAVGCAFYSLFNIITRSIKAKKIKEDRKARYFKNFEFGSSDQPKNRPVKWNSFTGYASEQDQIKETKERC